MARLFYDDCVCVCVKAIGIGNNVRRYGWTIVVVVTEPSEKPVASCLVVLQGSE